MPPPPSGYYYHGVYPGWTLAGEWWEDTSLADLLSYEEAVGKTVFYTYFSHAWYEGRFFPFDTTDWINGVGSVPFVRLFMQSDSEVLFRRDPIYNLQNILEGRFDADLRAWCAALRSLNRPVIAEYGTEVNGEWFPWNGKWNGKGRKDGYGDPREPDGPERFRDAYRRIISLCRSEGATNITWVWHVNAADWPRKKWNRLEKYYPGDEWIDWIGVSIYGAMTPLDEYPRTFRELMDAVYPRLTRLAPTKPVIIAEFGSTSGHPTVDAAEWADEAFRDLFAERWPGVIAFSWWNEHWQNDDNPAQDTNMRVQDNPALAQKFHLWVRDNSKVLGR